MSILGAWMRKEADKLTAARINSFEGKPFASNGHSKICAKAFELNKFKFLKIAVIGPLNVNTDEGCKVIFEINNKELPEIESDSTEIRTDFSQALGSGITEFDIDLDDDLITHLNEKIVNSILISFPNNFIRFFIHDISLLRAALIIPQPVEEENFESSEEEN